MRKPIIYFLRDTKNIKYHANFKLTYIIHRKTAKFERVRHEKFVTLLLMDI